MRARLFVALRALIAVWCLIGLDPAWAGTPGQDTVLFGRPGWVLSGAADDLNFATGQYFGLTPGQLTVSRASTEYEICNGRLFGPFANNALAVTPGCGAWIWEARTNAFLNNNAPATQSITTIIGLTYSISFYGTGTLTLSGACTQVINGSAFPAKTAYSCTATSTILTVTVTSLGGMQYPQVELNPNVPATVASAVKAADGTGGVNGSGVYTVTGGTCTTQPTLNVTWAAGVLTIGAVVNAGSCTVLPPSPATLAYSSGAATGWTGATATLTPVDNSAQGFATGPILTSSGAVTRAATVTNLPVSLLPLTRPGALLISAMLPSTYPLVSIYMEANDGTYNNRILVDSNSAVQAVGLTIRGGSSAQLYSNAGGSIVGSYRKSAFSWGYSTSIIGYDGTTTVSAASPGPPLAVTQAFLGGSNFIPGAIEGVIGRVTFFNNSLSSAQIQALTK